MAFRSVKKREGLDGFALQLASSLLNATLVMLISDASKRERIVNRVKPSQESLDDITTGQIPFQDT